MKTTAALALACALAVTGCKKEPRMAAEPAPTNPAQAPTSPAAKAHAEQATAGTPAASQPAKTPPLLPTAAELIALIDSATRIEARSGSDEDRAWSKDLTKEDIANLKAGLGKAEVSAGAPRCLPTVMVTIHKQDRVLAKLGAFCDRGSLSGLLRFEFNELMGSIKPQDAIKIGAALASPVDR